MSITEVKRVAYVALEVRDVEPMQAFYQEDVGLVDAGRDNEGNRYLCCDDGLTALVLVPTGSSGMHHFGLDVGCEATLGDVAARLGEHGKEVREVAPLRGQAAALEVTDPAGATVRLVVNGAESEPPPQTVRAVKPRRFGHLNLLSTAPLRQVRDFYVHALGFKVSDWLLDQVVWMRCNPDHHGVAYGAAGRSGLQHLCFEVRSLAELTHQADHLASRGHRLLWGPGRHGPGNNLFVYFADPERNVIEFTAEVEQLWHDENREQPWDPSTSPEWANQWGPGPSPEFLANMAPDFEP